MTSNHIIIQGLRQNNLKNISLELPKNQIIVFTGVSGSGKSSIVFDTIAAESQRQMNETYTAFMRGRLPKYEKPRVDLIDNLTASVIIDQSRLGGNARSTVGTISDLYAAVRLLYSRIGSPYVGTASYFSFNDPKGMCPECFGIGRVHSVDVEKRIDPEKTWREGMADLDAFHVGNYYWKKYAGSGVIPLDKKYKDFTERERNLLLYGAETKGGAPLSKDVDGLIPHFDRVLIRRSAEETKSTGVRKMFAELVEERVCPCCGGKRLNEQVRHACLHNLKNVSVSIPLGVLTVVTGVAGSGKSTLIRDVFAKQYADRVILVDQSPVTATGRSTAATYLGFFDDIRKLMAEHTHQPAALFTFNGAGACPECKGRGKIVTELVFMDPVTTVCESCEGARYSREALSHTYRGKNITGILAMSVEEAREFFADQPKIRKYLDALLEVGLPYLSIGQPLSTLSGGERQRVKLAKELYGKGSVYVLDEPTTGLHASDIGTLMQLFERMVDRGNTVIVIEHNTDVMKQADYIIDIGPDGGTMGGEVVFAGTVAEMVQNSDSITAKYIRRSLE